MAGVLVVLVVVVVVERAIGLILFKLLRGWSGA